MLAEGSTTSPLAPKDSTSYNAAQLSSPQRRASPRAITTNLITGGLGSAIFSLPWSVAGSSVIPSVFIIAGVLLLNAWTIGILVRAAERHQEFNLGSLLARLPGQLGGALQILANGLVWVSCFMCLVSYMIVIHDSSVRFVAGTTLEVRSHLITLASALVLPICFLNQQRLESTSSVAILINIYLFVLIGVLYGRSRAHSTLPEHTCWIGSTVRGEFALMSVMFQAVIVQMCVLPMYQELEDRSPRKMDRIVAASFSVLFIIFVGFSMLGYLYVGPGVQSNVLSDLPAGPYESVAQIGTALVVACVYPILVYPMIAPLTDMQARSLIDRTRRTPADCLVPVAKLMIVVLVAIAASFIESLGFVNTFNGAMSACFFVAIVPSVVGYFLLDGGVFHKVSLASLLVFGMVAGVMGLTYTGNYVEDLRCHLYAS
mmetsp:Transcript_33358/g.61183  ORF Transcript_33358/g.61183 Transcript_33358/m.61183 type:complete len:430 (-) Transcript_33358:105-1394(-)